MLDLVDLKNELSHLSMPDLLNIYAIFSQRLTHVIDVQWKLASIFIPLSLSGAVFLNEDQRSVILVGVFSILLIWIWYMFERRNQRSILRQQTILAAFESIIAEHDPAKFGRGFSIPNRFRGKKSATPCFLESLCIQFLVGTGHWDGVRLDYPVVHGTSDVRCQRFSIDREQRDPKPD